VKQFIRKLFGQDSGRPARRPAARPATRSRLGFEQLDDRLMPSATASVADGILTVSTNGPSQSDFVRVFQPQGSNQVMVFSNYDYVVSFDKRVPGQQVSRVLFRDADTDNTKTDMFVNMTNLDAEFHPGWGIGNRSEMIGGGGTNSFYANSPRSTYLVGSSLADFHGGSGTNVFYDAAGAQCHYYAGTGTNVLIRSGAQTSEPSRLVPGVASGPQLTAGLTPNPYQDDLDVGGVLTVSLDPAGGVLTLNGPTGAGFRLYGKWTDTMTSLTGGEYKHSFTATGPVTLRSGSILGDVPFNTLSQPVTITTKPIAFRGPVGEFDGMTWAGGLPLNQVGSTPFGGALQDVGLTFNGQGVSWGIALGSDLMDGGAGLGAFNDAPLNNAIPYLYANLGSGDGSAASLSYGGMSASVGSGAGVQVVFDPADPLLYARAVTGTVAGNWAAGYSVHGVIPFTPEKDVDGFGPGAIRGNLYESGSGIQLGALPASVSGEIVLDLDANDDGRLVGVGGRKVSDLLKTPAGTLGTVLNDIKFGANGTVELGYNLSGIDVAVQAGSATLMYAPGRLGLHGGHDNPFAGTPLEDYAPRNNELDLKGSISWANGWHWSVTATQTNAMPGKLSGSTYTISVTDFGIKVVSDFSLDLQVARAWAHTELSLVYSGGRLVLHGGLTADFVAGDDWWFNAHGHLDLDLTIATNFHQVQVSGSGHLSGGVTVAGHSQDLVGLGFDVDNNGFSIDLPLTNKDVRVRW
jgi:hypothetical protein